MIPATSRTYRRNEPTPANPPVVPGSPVPAVPQPAVALDPAELERRLLDVATRTVQDVRQQALEGAMGALESAIRTALTPNRSTLPTPATPEPTPGRPALSVVVTPGDELAYQQLPAAERAIRKPDVDHRLAEWIRGVAYRDDRRRLAAEDWLRQKGHIRADTLEGTTTAVSGLSQGTGGPLIPLPLANLIVRARNRIAKMRALATMFTSESLTLRVPVSAVGTAAMAAEGAVAAQGEPTLTSKLFSKKKMQFNAEASEEMLEDSAFNLVGLYSERAGQAFGELVDTQIATSNGTAPNITESLGSATITAVTEAVAGTVGYADVLKLYYALPQQYRRGACWMATSDVLALLSAIRTTGGMPLFSQQSGYAQPVVDDGPGSEGAIFGKPVYDVPTAAGELWFGNMSFFGVLEGGGIRVKTSDSALWAADSIAFRFTTRWDGLVLLEGAFRQMEGLTTAGT